MQAPPLQNTYMQNTYLQESHQAIVNGRVIENEVIKAMYDGKNMDIDVYKNGHHINAILSMKAHPQALEKRLMRDFGVKGKGKSKSKTYKQGKTYKKGKSNKGKSNKSNKSKTYKSKK